MILMTESVAMSGVKRGPVKGGFAVCAMVKLMLA